LDNPDGYIMSQFYVIFLSLTWTVQMLILWAMFMLYSVV